MRMKLNAVNAVLAVLVIVAYVWFFVISPTFVFKPAGEKPPLFGVPVADNVNWMVTELGAYKLHPNLIGGEPALIEVYVTDVKKSFTTVVAYDGPKTGAGPAINPDMRISLSTDDFTRLYNAGDVMKETVVLYKEGKAKIEILKDTATLTAKGYKAIYDALGM